eukprot:7383374-Prymnesium_polylepis.1
MALASPPPDGVPDGIRSPEGFARRALPSFKSLKSLADTSVFSSSRLEQFQPGTAKFCLALVTGSLLLVAGLLQLAAAESGWDDAKRSLWDDRALLLRECAS